jgi:hypothetical protein
MFLEKQLEDYIVNNLWDFEKLLLKTIYGNDHEMRDGEKIEFVGRQVMIDGKIIDLLFNIIEKDGPDDVEAFVNTLVVVELKKEKGTLDNLIQVIRYANYLNKRIGTYTRVVLVANDFNDDIQEISIYLEEHGFEDIYLITLNHTFNFKEQGWHFADEFKNCVIDERLKKYVIEE